LARRAEGGCELARMMRVVVDEADARDLASALVAARRSAEIPDRACSALARDSGPVEQGKRGDRIERVVRARYAHAHGNLGATGRREHEAGPLAVGRSFESPPAAPRT